MLLIQIVKQTSNGEGKGARGGQDPGAALPDDDGPGLGDLVSVYLDPEALSLGVSAVLGAPGPLLVRHLDGEPPRRHRHAHAHGAADGERGAVAAQEGGGGGHQGEALEGPR